MSLVAQLTDEVSRPGLNPRRWPISPDLAGSLRTHFQMGSRSRQATWDPGLDPVLEETTELGHVLRGKDNLINLRTQELRAIRVTTSF